MGWLKAFLFSGLRTEPRYNVDRGGDSTTGHTYTGRTGFYKLKQNH